MSTPLPVRKHPRLDNKALYCHPGTVVHVVIGTKNKSACLAEPAAAAGFCKVLKDVARENEVLVHAYCVMPDHVHLLVEAAAGMGVIEFVKRVKGRFATWCRKNGRQIALQPSFYDHVLRRNEDLETVCRYIIGNPVRAGIETEYGVYPFAGSLTADHRRAGFHTSPPPWHREPSGGI